MAVLRVAAHIYLRTADEGGRQGYVASGYRPLLRFEDRYTEGAIRLIDRDRALPGESLDVYIDLPNAGYVADQLRIGADFIISEATHDVGSGTITAMPLSQ